MDFTQAAKYLLSLGNEVSAMKLGLASMTVLLGELGDPQKNYPKVQIAGTNGKGSVCAFLESICLDAGIMTGLTTSPHLVSMTERVRINGLQISEAAFAKLATRVRASAEKLVAATELERVPTYFEQVTAIALLAFAEANVELAILETGLGGRLDATTAASAEFVGITRIDYDHQQYLGHSLKEIASEKAAVIRGDTVAVVGRQDAKAMQVILQQRRGLNVSPKLADDVRTARGSGWVKFETEQSKYVIERLGLLGAHQIENAEIAILLAESLNEKFPISNHNIVDGLQSARHPGRLEFRGRYLFDGAHNRGGAKALRTYLDENIPQPLTIIFGAMRDKDIEPIAELLFPKADLLFLTSLKNSRAVDPDELEAIARRHIKPNRIMKTASVAEALTKAEQLSDADAIILITGSLYLIGEAQAILESKPEI
jgi:dihydrofolate synthase/folylpolyglutamate synthase